MVFLAAITTQWISVSVEPRGVAANRRRRRVSEILRHIQLRAWRRELRAAARAGRPRAAPLRAGGHDSGVARGARHRQLHDGAVTDRIVDRAADQLPGSGPPVLARQGDLRIALSPACAGPAISDQSRDRHRGQPHRRRGGCGAPRRRDRRVPGVSRPAVRRPRNGGAQPRVPAVLDRDCHTAAG